MMRMTIIFDCEALIIADIFEFNDCGFLSLTCLLFFLLSIFFEYLLTIKSKKYNEIFEYDNINIDSSYVLNYMDKLIMCFIHVSVCFMIYFLMFAMMAYNGYLIISIILGNLIGFYLFGVSKKNSIRNLNNIGCCHSG